MTKVFIDGSAGTTGLRIRERLAERSDLTVLSLPEELRKDPASRGAIMNEADVVFLCLPDQASEEAIRMIRPDVTVIDTSTAHRTAEGWTYGLPELAGSRETIRTSNRIANPGCHASGFLTLVEPLVREGLVAKETALVCFSVTGYSGGGKAMIADYQSAERAAEFDAPRQYALTQNHKHLKEMAAVAGLETAPVFCPIVGDYYSGMCVTVPLFRKDLRGTVRDVEELYGELYNGPVVRFRPSSDLTGGDPLAGRGVIAGNALSGYDDMEILVTGNDERILLVSVFDNLGKGASGAAIQNMNIRTGAAETAGLVLRGNEI